MSPRTTGEPGHAAQSLPAAEAAKAPMGATSSENTTKVSSSGESVPLTCESSPSIETEAYYMTSMSAKPIANGFKSLAWTKPAAENLRSAPLTVKQHKNHTTTGYSSPPDRVPARVVVSPPAVPDAPGLPCSSTTKTPTDVAATSVTETNHVPPGKASEAIRRGQRKGYLEGVQEDASVVLGQEAWNDHRNLSSDDGDKRRRSSADGRQSRRQNQQVSFHQPPPDIQRSVIDHQEEEEEKEDRESPSTSTTFTELEAAQRVWNRVLPRREPGKLDRSAPSRFPLAASDDILGIDRVERSLSDSSIVTTSDFGGSGLKVTPPTVLHEISDEDALAGLDRLCSKGRGLQVVKHAGYGGGKSRKYMKFSEQEKMLVFSGVLPPYLKTVKIPIEDIDRTEAKWCSVVLHARERPAPVILEVDSIETARVLKAGLMVASQREASEKEKEQERQRQQQAPKREPAEPTHAREDSLGSDLGLAVVRPGHRASAVYDPDAALSVAALLAKEMEEERARDEAKEQDAQRARDDLSASYHKVETRPSNFSERVKLTRHAAKRSLTRSLSLSSVASTAVSVEENSTPKQEHRKSLPRPQTEESIAQKNEEELTVVDGAAALRRLNTATGGRGLMAIKTKSTGKGRSRVLVRTRMDAGTIGWAQVLPPFTRKNIPWKNLIEATRSVRVVTLKIKDLDPVLLEPDRLTDAIILEQGFSCLAAIAKTPT